MSEETYSCGAKRMFDIRGGWFHCQKCGGRHFVNLPKSILRDSPFYVNDNEADVNVEEVEGV